jgi:chorismate lyase
MKSSFLWRKPPRWQADLPGMCHTLPGNVPSWVYETGSLTRRLRQHYPNVKVTLVFHQWAKPLLDECRLLHIPPHRYALTREVMLHDDNQPLLLARTIIPEATLKGAHRNLSHLGNRPLGEVIFAYPHLQRLALQTTLVNLTCWSQPAIALAGLHSSVWGRRTVYAIAGQAMLVSEFFLPEILYPNDRNG